MLYLGLNLPTVQNKKVIHFPIIKIIPTPYENVQIQQALCQLPHYTHLIFSSQSAVNIFFNYQKIKRMPLGIKKIVAVGKATARAIEKFHQPVEICAKEESAEGIIKELTRMDLRQAFVFWPHSALSRTLIKDFLVHENVNHCECVLYNTKTNHSLPIPDLNEVDEIVFTSPSCVDAFLEIFKQFPLTKKLTTIGPITEAYLKSCINKPLSQ